ncbi:MAG: hypothetical protein ABS75_32270 [Pelagibacterium sp. SCN 63-23]|nr:MAG: hypothetical protein ABS75_32270 [Pelagibacterium sp. SCN 63-23]
MSTVGASRNGLMVIVIRIAGAGLALLAQVIASRIVGAEEFGRYSLMLVWLLLLGHGGTIGTNPLLYRYVAQYLKAGDYSAIAGLLRFAIGVVIAASATLVIIALALLYSGLLPIEPDLVVVGALAFSAVPLLALQDFFESIARGIDRPTLGIGPAYMVRHIAIIVGVGGFFFLGFGASAATVMGATIAGLVISLIMQYALLQRYLSPIVGGRRPRYHIAEWVRTALPMAIGDAAEVLFMNADILILGIFVEPEMVAFYFAATRLAQILAYVPYGMSAATAQRMAALAEHDERDSLARLVARTTLVSGGLATLGALAVTILAVPLLTMFGPDYAGAAGLVPVLCGGIAAACLLGPGEDVLNMLGQERLASLSIAVALAVNIGLNFTLIPQMGPMGAAIASAVALILRGLLMAIFAYQRLGLLLPFGAAFAANRGAR